MNTLPTKEQILRKWIMKGAGDNPEEYVFSSHAEWAMEEYLAVRAKPLVDMLNKLNNSISNMDGMYLHSVSFKEAMKGLFDLSEEYAKALSSYTGEQPKMSEFEKAIASVVENRVKEPDSDVLEKVQREQPVQQPAITAQGFAEWLDLERNKSGDGLWRRDTTIWGKENAFEIMLSHFVQFKAGEQPLKSEG